MRQPGPGHVMTTTMTDNPEPKGKGISTRFSNILRQKLSKKPKNNDSNDSISIYASDDSDKKPRKIANVPNRKPVYKNPFSAIPSGGTQEAVANALAETDRISDYTLSPPPTVPLVASPPRSSVVANAGITLVISSSQESEQVRDAGAALAQLTEYTLDDEPSSSPPKITYVEEKAVSRPGSTTPTRNRTRPTERQVTPMEDWVFSSQELHWFKRLEAGGYPTTKALERCIKYYTITNQAIANIIENRQLYDDTDEKRTARIHSFKKSKNSANQISSIAENALYNGTEAGPSRPESPMKQDEEEDTYMGEPEPGPNQPNPLTPKSAGDPTPNQASGEDTQANQRRHTRPPPIHSFHAPGDFNQDGAARRHQVPTRQARRQIAAVLPQPSTLHKRVPALPMLRQRHQPKPRRSKPLNIAAAIKRDIAKPAPAQSDDKNFVVRFKTLPVTQPNPESIFVAMRECLDAANRNLGKGRLTRVRWSLKASLHLSFSNNVSITAIENAIPLLMDRLRLPEYEFGPEVPWSRLVVTNVPTGMGGSLQRMRNREELTQLLNEAFPDSAKFGSVKLTLAPDWLADPARLQAEGRNASTVSFAFEDAGGNAKSRSSTQNLYSKPARNASATDTPNANAEPKNHAATNADVTTTQPKNTTRTTALAVSVTAKATRANASTARPAASTAIVSIPPIAPRCPNSDAPSRKLLLTGPQTAMTERHCIQLNVAGCNPRMHALLNEPLYAHFDIFIFQDIWWGRIGSQKNIDPTLHNIYGTANSNNFLCIIPPGFTDEKGPSVAMYIRKERNIHAQFSNCVPIHRDILAVDLFLDNHKFTIVNVYAHGKEAHRTINHLTNEIIPIDRPLILTGDFNLHHPDWALDGSKWKNRHPNQTEREFRDYAEFNDLTIMNHTSHPTRIASNPASNSIIDLTFLNNRAVEAWPDFNWEVDTPSTGRSCGSDHMAITWSIQPFDQDEPVEEAILTSHRPIDPKREDKWVEAYAKALKKFDLPEDPNTAEDADLITGAILEAMSTATIKTMPDGNKKKKGNGPPRSPWWNAECSGALNDLKHNPENRTREQLRSTLRGAIRRARRSHGDRILAEIRTSKVFESLKWFQGKRRSLLPPIKSPNGGLTATHPHHKAENLAKQFFPSIANPNISLHPLGIRAMTKRPFQEISTDEIANAIKCTSNKSSPGAFGSNYRLLKWAFWCDTSIFVNLFNLCLRIGYHPSVLRNCVIAPIPKPRRQDMSLPKNYRPIALLETLSKLLEKVITTRITSEAGKHSLIPHSQFGGKDITSCTDAGLCMIHDIKSHWKSNHRVSLITLDVSGYFNNVDHRRLIYTLDRMGYPNQICNWLRSYLSHRTAQFRVDGHLCPPIALPPVGIPQDPHAQSFAYIDDFTILAWGKSHEYNVATMRRIATRVSHTASQLGLEFEIDKSDLIHFYRHSNHSSNPSLHLALNGKNYTILPQGCIRWLGFYLDRKLTFKEHISNSTNKAKAIIAGLGMLANTQRGLTIKHARILYLTCVIPILTYGSPLWFLGRRQKSLLEPLRKVQNQGLRWLLGAFKTTPIPCLEHLASIPPIHITCQKLIMNYSAKLRTIPKSSEVAKRLPASWDTHTPTLNSNRNNKAESLQSPIHFIASHSHPHIEFVSTHINHPSDPAIPFPDQIKIKDTSDGLKRDEYRDKILSEISVLEDCHASVLGYSDGHAAVSNGIRKVGVGYVIRAGKRTLSSSSIGIGPRANIYDAEMLGILLAFMKAKQIAENQGYRKIRIYCDNQAAVRSIADLSRHPCQFASRVFVPAAKAFVEGHPERSIHITWTPGHNGVEGNETADRLANEGARATPTPIFNRTITWAREQATRKTVRSWKKAWHDHTESRINSKYYIPRPPALKLHPIFNTSKLGRDLECRLVQYLTGHGHYGEYHAQFHHDVDPRCACGESDETIFHLTTSCPATAGHRGILSEFSTNINDPTLFGSLAGLEAVAKFIARTGIGRRRGGPQATAQTM
ncbi:Reverse transcriptase (RNA-dependent DNA polymerase) [Rhizoctonia solani]|uniref:Reverse transcriptase (RNA-dependent DNA polymerase) n=1 Tax=Rhizoctonia solani TaxID=456999 RepID=A0A8H7I8N4_9AGAM|nr:Reverse transcriptase (RNA-dependent DNA polymerase) [Rhizoctonia solani]